ncbi:MAG: DNA polymerase I [Chloroflexi bacterium RBG_16_60_22]|nr:MAG: DNA polymerase I [Chloroflexi bacterium RBG_16_60_22]
MEKPLLVLFDGNAIVHRAYHAFGATRYRQATPLTVSKTGEVVSAVYGFALMLLKVLSDLKPTHYAIAFDRKGPTFRHKLYDKYKAQRPPTPPELVGQIDRVKQLVQAFRIPLFEVDNYEADDVLGTLSRQASQQEIDTVIVTGDADTMQLVSPHVKVLYPRAGKAFSDTQLFDGAAVSEKYGVGPEHIADLKALVGDASDNIPGVPGIGDKTAVKLIRQFGDLDGVYQHLEEVTPPRAQEALRQHEATAHRSKELATIVTETPVKLDLEECRVSQYERRQVADFFRELGFFSLLPKLPGTEGESTPEGVTAGPAETHYRITASTEDLDALVNTLAAAKSFAFDTETTGLDPMLAQPVGISLATGPGNAYYIPIGHALLDEVTQLPREQVVSRLKPIFEDAGIAKLAHNGKYDMMVLAECGINVKGLTFDSMIAAYLLGEKSLGLKALSFSKLGIEMTPISSLIGTGARQVSMAQVDIKRAADYACADADMTWRLSDLLGKELEKQGFMKLFTGVEMPLVPVLLLMERNGVAVDTGMLKEMSRNLGEQITVLEGKIYEESKHEFNINSPAQLGKVLFDEMQLPTSRRGKSKYSTEAAVLEELRLNHDIAKYILEYRQLAKIKSTYIDTLPALVNPKTGRIHTSFNQTRAVTGRLSSSDPNMQNIPVRGELGGQVRQAFIAPGGTSLFGGDYSQIDLRVLAHLSGDEHLVRAFKYDEDIHAATAALLFGVEKSKVTPDMRRFAKTVNFGVIYGMSDYGLEQATELSREDAGKFIRAYFEKYPGVRKYLDETKEKARREGYVQTLLGRRRFIPDINAANRQVREGAERMAINMPVQGTSADIIKVAMINLYREMEKKKLKSKMLLQVHDELLFEVPGEELATMRKLVPEVMSTAVELSVPVKVDTKEGKNWGEMK